MRRALKTAQTAPYVQPPTGMQAARATPLRHGLPAGKPTGRKPPHSGGPRRNGLCGNTLQGPRRHRQPGSLPWPQPSHSGHARRLCYNRPQPRHTHRCPPPQPQQRQAIRHRSCRKTAFWHKLLFKINRYNRPCRCLPLSLPPSCVLFDGN